MDFAPQWTGNTVVFHVPSILVKLQRTMRQWMVLFRLIRKGGVVGYRHDWDAKRKLPYRKNHWRRNPFRPFLLPFIDDIDHVIFNQVSIRPDDMAALRNVPTITAVALLDCVIQPDAVAEIAAMTSLRHLSLAGTKITEEDLGTLARLCYLEELVVSEAGLTREGLTRFKELLPACRVQLYAEVPRRTAKKA